MSFSDWNTKVLKYALWVLGFSALALPLALFLFAKTPERRPPSPRPVAKATRAATTPTGDETVMILTPMTPSPKGK
jgi:hypothetical protein